MPLPLQPPSLSKIHNSRQNNNITSSSKQSVAFLQDNLIHMSPYHSSLTSSSSSSFSSSSISSSHHLLLPSHTLFIFLVLFLVDIFVISSVTTFHTIQHHRHRHPHHRHHNIVQTNTRNMSNQYQR